MRSLAYLSICLTLTAVVGCKSADDTSDDSDATDTDAASTDDGTTDQTQGDTDEDDTTGEVTEYDDNCDDPLVEDTICATIDDYGTRLFTLNKFRAAQAITATDDPAGKAEALIIQHVDFQDTQIPVGTTDCTGQNFVTFIVNGGASQGGKTYEAKAGRGSCSLVVTTGGAWKTDPVIGTFTATVVEYEGTAKRTISGSFSYTGEKQ